jgi:glycosidase
VPNHTSDEHDWFKKSVKQEEKYIDYYVWHYGITNDTDSYPPNNWVGLVHVMLWDILH